MTVAQILASLITAPAERFDLRNTLDASRRASARI
jgi:hypothetical protein